MMKDNKFVKKLTSSITTVIILIICICITTFALFFERTSVNNNIFRSGNIEINLNDGKPIIRKNEFVFEPGMTVKKDFFIKNNSTWNVYYKLYFDNVEGELADILDITIKNGNEVLYIGKASEFKKGTMGAANDMLKLNEKRNLSLYFYYPETAGNDTQNLTLAFDLCADAVQSKNNPNRNFN